MRTSVKGGRPRLSPQERQSGILAARTAFGHSTVVVSCLMEGGVRGHFATAAPGPFNPVGE